MNDLKINEPSLNQENEIILEVKDLKKYFPIETNFFGTPTRFLKAVDNVSFKLKKGTTIGIVGESGCGKTTLGRTILKLYESNGGQIFFEGKDLTKLKKHQMAKFRTSMQLIFQDPYSSLPPRMTIGNIISEAVRVHKIVPKNEVTQYVLDIMKKCGLQPHYFDRYPHEFSGGQRQRICIARALAVKPKLVVCDEPVSALDVSIQAQIINLLKELQIKDELTYIFISHDLSVVKYITEQIMVMYLGNVMEYGETDEIFDNPLHPYTKALFSAVPVPDPDVKMNRIILTGDIPSPANPPLGCKFHTRCKDCMGVCKKLNPKYIEATPNHFVACHLFDPEVMANLDQYEEVIEEKEVIIENEEDVKKDELAIENINEEVLENIEENAIDTLKEEPVQNTNIDIELYRQEVKKHKRQLNAYKKAKRNKKILTKFQIKENRLKKAKYKKTLKIEKKQLDSLIKQEKIALQNARKIYKNYYHELSLKDKQNKKNE